MQEQQAINQAANDAAYQTGAAIGTGLAYLLVAAVVLGLTFAVICGNMARVRGRSASAGILGGFIFGLWSVLPYYLIVGDTVERKVAREDAARQALREKRIQDKIDAIED